MSEAQYFCTGSLSPDQHFHYGLAVDQYTHFTSPIRRYADCIAHRQLMLALLKTEANGGPVACAGNQYARDHIGPVIPTDAMQELAVHINECNRASKHCQTEATELYQVIIYL